VLSGVIEQLPQRDARHVVTLLRAASCNLYMPFP
jgi:hypothetical protein